MGSSAPALEVQKWLQGTATSAFEKDTVYVLDFWATWCQPCISAIPHMNEIQSRYSGKVKIIGIAGSERGTPEEKEASVVKFLREDKTKIHYPVALDFERKMVMNWGKAAGENTIPQIFIVQNNRVLFIGTPKEIDPALEKIVAGKWVPHEMERYREERRVRKIKAARLRTISERVNAATEKDEWQRVVNILRRHNPLTKDDFNSQTTKGQALIQLGKLDEGYSILEKQVPLAKETYQKVYLLQQMLAPSIPTEKINFSLAKDLANDLLHAEKSDASYAVYHAFTYPPVAEYYARLGDYQKAAELQKQALTNVHSNLQVRVEGMQKNLAEYESAAENCVGGVCSIPAADFGGCADPFGKIKK